MDLELRGPASATPLLCLPGLLGDACVFEPFAPLAAARRTVRAWDLPPGDPRAAAARIASRLDRPHHLLTGSYGGLVARCLPPGKLASIACVATLPALDLTPPGIARRTRVLRWMPDRVVELLYRRHSHRSLALDGVPPELVARTRGLDAATLRERLDGVLAWELPPAPEVPTLWVLGATDPEAPWSVDEVLARRPEVEVCHVPGGHRPYASHPGPLLTRLERFWALS